MQTLAGKKAGQVTEKPRGRGCVSSAVMLELEKNGGKFHTLCEEHQKYKSTDDNCYLKSICYTKHCLCIS